MQKLLLYPILILSIFILFPCCEEEPDDGGNDLPPEYDNLKLNNTTTPTSLEPIVILDGTTAVLSGMLMDDVELASYRIRVRNGLTAATGPDVWDIEESISISGTSLTLSENITVPVDARGGFYLMDVRVSDSKGQHSAIEEFHLIVRNTSTSVIAISGPMTNNTYSPGQNITMLGTVTDDIDIKTVRIVVERIKDLNGDPVNNGPSFYAETFFLNNNNDNTWNFNQLVSNNLPIEIPANLTEFGTYGIFVSVTDNVDNIAFERRDVIINN